MLNEQMRSELSRATRMIPLEGGDLKVVTLVGDEQRVYFVEQKDVQAFFEVYDQRMREGRKG